jgi:Helix-turn-helix
LDRISQATAGLTFWRGGADAAVRVQQKAKGQSQKVLAAEIGISVVTLSNIERGENVHTLGVFLRRTHPARAAL